MVKQTLQTPAVVYTVFGILLLLIFTYAILKEREELGCYRVSIGRQCNDQQSVYLKGTKMSDDDDDTILREKLVSILSYHEKAGVWKRCVILATILLVVTILLDSAFASNIAKWIVMFVLYATIVYFYFNYVNFHHFRNLKNNGVEILETIYSRRAN